MCGSQVNIKVYGVKPVVLDTEQLMAFMIPGSQLTQFVWSILLVVALINMFSVQNYLSIWPLDLRLSKGVLWCRVF